MKYMIMALFFVSQGVYAQSCTQLRECLGIVSTLTGMTFLMDKGVIEGNPKVKGRLLKTANAEKTLVEILSENKLSLETTGSPNLYKIIKVSTTKEARKSLKKWQTSKK